MMDRRLGRTGGGGGTSTHGSAFGFWTALQNS